MDNSRGTLSASRSDPRPMQAPPPARLGERPSSARARNARFGSNSIDSAGSVRPLESLDQAAPSEPPPNRVPQAMDRMAEIRYWTQVATEQFSPGDLVDQAVEAERAEKVAA